MIDETLAPTLFNRDEITGLLVARGITCPILIASEDFAMPLQRWVETTESAGFTLLLKQLGYEYQEQSRACDSFTRFSAWYAQDQHARTIARRKLPPCALAIGELWFENGFFTGHALAISICAPTPEDIHFHEPQPSAGLLGVSLKEVLDLDFTRKHPVMCRI